MRWMICAALAACGGPRSSTVPKTSTATSEPTALARPVVAPELAVPDAAKLVLIGEAKGVQIYECADGAWKLHAPRAELFDGAGVSLAQHFGGVDRGKAPGPWWEAKDGSAVNGSKPVSVPNPGSIPLLRLEGAASGTGVLAHVAFIQRLDTTGGVAPADACTAGQTQDVPYTATYYFYDAPTG